MKSTFKRIACALFAALLSTAGSFAQDKIYLVKNDKLVATYDINDVDYMTFEWDNSIKTDDFTIQIDNIDYTSVEWTITPTDPDMYYYTNVYGDMESLEAMGSTQDLADRLYHDMQFLAGMASMDVTEFMETQVLYKGQQQVGYYQLGPDSEYTIVVFGCNPYGQATTEDYAVTPFSTPAMEKNSLTVDFEINVNGCDATITSTPSDNTIRYYVTVKAEDETFDPQGEMNNFIWQGSVMGRSPEEVVEQKTVLGTATNTYELNPTTNYTVYAVSYTAEGVVNSEVSSEDFSTESIQQSDNTFTITPGEITATTCSITVTPSNDDCYTVIFRPASEIEGMTDQEILDSYANTFEAMYNSNTGQQVIYRDYLTPETDYVLMVFGFKQYTATTGLSKLSVRTLEGSDPATWTAIFENIRIDNSSMVATADIRVNQQDISYLWNVVDENATADQIREYYKSEFDRYVGMGINYVEMRSIQGDNTVTHSEMVEGEKYRMFAVVMDKETGELVTDIFFSDLYTTEGVVSNAPMKKSSDNNNAPIKFYIPEKADLYPQLPVKLNKANR